MTELNLPKNWIRPATAAEAAEYEAELIKEVTPGHVLYGHKARVLAHHDYMDDVLYQLDDGRLFEVHLTYNVETTPHWPTVDEVESLDEWYAHWSRLG